MPNPSSAPSPKNNESIYSLLSTVPGTAASEARAWIALLDEAGIARRSLSALLGFLDSKAKGKSQDVILAAVDSIYKAHPSIVNTVIPEKDTAWVTSVNQAAADHFNSFTSGFLGIGQVSLLGMGANLFIEWFTSEWKIQMAVNHSEISSIKSKAKSFPSLNKYCVDLESAEARSKVIQNQINSCVGVEYFS